MHKITAFIVAEAVRAKKGKEVSLTPVVKSAPHYFEKSVPAQHLLKQEAMKFDGMEVKMAVKSYHPDAILAEGSFEVENVFAPNMLDLKDKLIDACYDLIQKNGGKRETAEEYTVYQIAGYAGDPEVFLKGKESRIAGLLKSERMPLDEKEVEYTLSYQLKYAKDDLVIMDWDGAFVFDPKGEFGEIVELFELANYQLLRYRMLASDLDSRLQKTAKLAEGPAIGWSFLRASEIAQAYREVIRMRTQSISEFEALDRDIKLIGDWYFARLYDLTTKKFKLDEWRGAVKEKLESLEDVYSIISENFSISRQQIFDIIQTAGWFILLIGYFVLFFLESHGIK